MPASLRDVAKVAGVSVMTVSNVINGYQHVSPETRARVEAAIGQVHYRPNISARNLRSGRSGVISLAIPELLNPYFAQLAHLIGEAAARHALTVLIDETGGDRQRELLVASGSRTQLHDGLILTPRTLTADDLRGRVDDIPLVVLGERVTGDHIDGVTVDSFEVGLAATKHLVELGRHRIAAIGVDPGRSPFEVANRRLDGYCAALAEASLPYDPELVVPAGSFIPDVGMYAMERLLALSEPPDAVFCFNDLLALGACRALHLARRRIPQDVAVIGVDDTDAGRYSFPSLSSIAPDKQAIARTAVDMLVARQGHGRTRPTRHVTAGFSLVARESTLGVPRRGRASSKAP